MQTFAGIAYEFGEPGLDVHVNVFQLGLELHLALRNLYFDSGKTFENGIKFILR